MVLKIILIIFIGLATTTQYSVAQKKWAGPANGNWSDALNWLPQGVPTSSDDVILDNSFQKNDYIVKLPDTTVNVHTLWLVPSIGVNIELTIPISSKASPALVVTGTGTSVIIKKGAVFKNSSGLSSGQSVQLNGLLTIFNDGVYVHNSRSSHATEVVARLSSAPGTERGIFEFDVPGGSYPISFSNRTYGTLKLSSVASGGSQVYNASGANPVLIRGDFQLNNGVQFNMDMTKDMVITGEYKQNGGVFNLASQANNNTVKIRGNVYQSSAGVITESSGGLPIIELCGSVNQQVFAEGTILNSVGFKINNANGVTLASPLILSYKLQLVEGKLKTSAVNMLILSDNCVAMGGSEASFIDGPLQKNGDDDFEFPVGKQGDYAPLKITGTGGQVMDIFVAEYFLGDPALKYGVSFESPPLVRISNIEYWQLNRLSGSSTKKVGVFVGKYSNATELGKLALVRWEMRKLSWKNEGNSFFSGISTGTLVSNDISNFGAFTLGSTVLTQNPLPVASLQPQVRYVDDKIELQWDISGIEEPDHFDIEQSVNGAEYLVVHRVSMISGLKRYSYIQPASQYSTVSLRVKVFQKNGDYFYSRPVTLTGNQSPGKIIRIFPFNVTNCINVKIDVGREDLLQVVVTDISGRRLLNIKRKAVAGILTFELSYLPKGVYYISVAGNRFGYYSSKFIKL